MEKRNGPEKLKSVVLTEEEWTEILELIGLAVDECETGVWDREHAPRFIAIQNKLKAILSSQT